MSKLRIEYATISERGDREVNEDSLGAVLLGANAFFVLADGLGGHGLGDRASAMVVEAALVSFREHGADLDTCFIHAQEKLMVEQVQLHAENDMKTTMVALHLKDDKASWAHVGDSRFYWFQGSKIRRQTLDHSIPQMLVATGEIRPKDIRGHEDRNRLYRVMGIEWSTPKHELSEEVALSGRDSFLLCSDGFWEYITERKMQRLLKASSSAEDWLSRLDAEAKSKSKGKKRDNYSAIAVFVREE